MLFVKKNFGIYYLIGGFFLFVCLIWRFNCSVFGVEDYFQLIFNFLVIIVCFFVKILVFSGVDINLISYCEMEWYEEAIRVLNLVRFFVCYYYSN